MRVFRSVAAAASLLALSAASAWAGPTYSFSLNQTDVSQFPNAGVGTVTLSQISANSVGVLVDLNAAFGLLNTGGPHTPFSFNLGSVTGLSIAFTTPTNGTFSKGSFSLNTAGGSNTPFGSFSVAIDSTAGKGSSNAYFGDLGFTLTRASGLDTSNFITNAAGSYFAADITNGTNTGAVAAKTRTTPTVPVPEPLSMTLLATGLISLGLILRFRNRA
jgi:hypothetical protein